MNMEKKTFETVDGVLSMLTMPKECPISVTIDERGYVLLRVGPRDWIWDDSGKFLGAGTMLGGGGDFPPGPPAEESQVPTNGEGDASPRG